MNSAAELRHLQGWLQAVVRHPEGVAAGLASGEAKAWLEVAPGSLETVIAPSAALSAEERMGLYARSYWLRLLECLRALHPALRHALGEELFDEFALDYLRAHPSTSYTLFELGARLADHLSATQPELGAGEEPWPAFLVDLARLERMFLEVYDGPGVEGERLLAADDLPDEPQEGWTVAAVPCLRLLASPYPVGRYLLDVRSGSEPPLPAPEQCYLALTRRDYTVVISELAGAPYQLLSALGSGVAVGRAASGAGMSGGEAWRHVHGWAGQGFFRAASPATGERSVAGW
ncbi:MAG TPA: DNA-binding domain-containing protein [Actinomycetota bacterium]|nr:DNA-binding domain-containing protein [Actinomycetota bacterium]